MPLYIPPMPLNCNTACFCPCFLSSFEVFLQCTHRAIRGLVPAGRDKGMDNNDLREMKENMDLSMGADDCSCQASNGFLAYDSLGVLKCTTGDAAYYMENFLGAFIEHYGQCDV